MDSKTEKESLTTVQSEQKSNDCINVSMARQSPCSKEYRPVCGCNQQTYNNECLAKKAGVLKWEKGKCLEAGEKIEGSYMVLLDEKLFPIYQERTAQVNDRSIDRNQLSQSQSKYDKTIRKDILKFAKEKLGLLPQQITHIYSGAFVGFSVQLTKEKSKHFLPKAKATSGITEVVQNQKAGIN